MGRLLACRPRLVGGGRLPCLGLGMAGRRRGAPRLCSGRRQVRGRPTSRHRRRRRRRRLHSRACGRRGVVRRPGSDARAHGDDRHRRRIQGVAHASGNPAGSEGRDPRRGRPDRGPWPVGQCRAPGRVRSSRHSGRRGRLRRPTRPAPAAACPQPSPGTCGAARPDSVTRSLTRAPAGCRATRSGSGGSRAGARRSCAVSSVSSGVGDCASCRRTRTRIRTRARRRDAGGCCREDLEDVSDSHCCPNGCSGAGRDLPAHVRRIAGRNQARDGADETHGPGRWTG